MLGEYCTTQQDKIIEDVIDTWWLQMNHHASHDSTSLRGDAKIQNQAKLSVDIA